jgi:drug/metabolite transporter (DMT)-like permease
VVFAIVWGMAFFGETPGALALLGAILVIGGTLAVALSPDRPAVRPRPA